jgi:hypothetical protein
VGTRRNIRKTGAHPKTENAERSLRILEHLRRRFPAAIVVNPILKMGSHITNAQLIGRRTIFHGKALIARGVRVLRSLFMF